MYSGAFSFADRWFKLSHIFLKRKILQAFVSQEIRRKAYDMDNPLQAKRSSGLWKIHIYLNPVAG